MTNRHGRRRCAYTLVEMIAVMAVFTMVLTLGATLLTLLFRLGDAARLHTDGLQTTARLARMLRADVRVAHTAEVTPADDRLTLVLGGDRVVQYEAVPRAIKRTVTVGGQQAAVERFRMHRGAARFEQARADGRAWVTLVLDHHVEPRGDNRPHELRLTAAVAADLRFEEARP